MKEFEDFIKLYLSQADEPLAKDEQEKLFRELSEIKQRYGIESEIYKDKRKTIINHNLRLCANFAINYCKSKNIIKDIQDVNSQCIMFMVSIIDNFDIDRGTEFSTYLYSSLGGMLSNYNKALRKDAIYYSDGEVSYTDHRDETKVSNIFDIIPDLSESFVEQDAGFIDFMKDITQFIDNIPKIRNSEIMKMYLGLGFDKRYSVIEISENFKLSRETISTIISKEKDNLIRYIYKNYPNTIVSGKEEPLHTNNTNVKFNTKEERVLYMVYSFYGYTLPKKSAIVIANEFGISPSYVRRQIKNYIDGLSSEEKNKIISKNYSKDENEKALKLSDNEMFQIFKLYYGIDCDSCLMQDEILVNFNVTQENLMKIVNEYKNKVINNGLYSESDFENFCHIKNKKIFMSRGYEFFSYYGYKNIQKKTIFDLSEELNLSYDQVASRITSFEKFLNNLIYDEREKLMKEFFSKNEHGMLN